MLGFLLIWAPLFFLAYLSMRWRQRVLGIRYGDVDFDPTLPAALFVPPVAILFALADITCSKLGLRGEGERAI